MVIAESFKFKEITGFKFGQSLFGKPYLYAHVYFIDGLLIDTGHSRMRQQITQMLSPLDVQQIFITHHHEDHTGNLHALSKIFACPTRSSKRCAEIMTSPPSISPAQYITWGSRKAFNQLTPICKTIQTNKYNFEIIPVPGHAEDMVALYEPTNGWLFSADLYVNHYIKYFMHSESMLQQITSIKTLLEYDFDVILCGHNPQLKNGKEKMQQKLQFLEDFYGRVQNLYHKGIQDPQRIMLNMNLKEFWMIRIMSLGSLSTLNMVKSVLSDIKNQ